MPVHHFLNQTIKSDMQTLVVDGKIMSVVLHRPKVKPQHYYWLVTACSVSLPENGKSILYRPHKD